VLRRAADLMARQLAAPSVMPGYWTTGRPTEWTASVVHSGAGDEGLAAQAADAVLANNKDYQYCNAARLHTALCTVVQGGVAEGLAQATELIDGISKQYRTTLVTQTGAMVLRAVPVQHRQQPQVVEFRALLDEA
jgi:hypothetical protein